ncbi:MAG TPA: hypothetical protein ENH10_06555, partial [Bacteroidetes bacterium]|nr:hypothetical protein [Bacteroidota bacterium]HEX04803.1 hypothetical protein [Bacteroidota bacterium]
MLRTAITFLLLLFVVSVVSANDSQPIPWRDSRDYSDQYIHQQLMDAHVESMDEISSFLADGQKQPLRTFDDEADPVVQVGLTLEEKLYLRKKPSEALLRSAVLPGWGQRYGERNVRGAIFSGVEAGLWTMLLLSRQSWLEGEDDYMTFASQHAGISGDKDH